MDGLPHFYFVRKKYLKNENKATLVVNQSLPGYDATRVVSKRRNYFLTVNTSDTSTDDLMNHVRISYIILSGIEKSAWPYDFCKRKVTSQIQSSQRGKGKHRDLVR